MCGDGRGEGRGESRRAVLSFRELTDLVSSLSPPQWVDILVLYTTGKYTRASSPSDRKATTSPTPPVLPRSSTSSSIQSVVASYSSNSMSRKPSTRKLSKDDIVIGASQPLSSIPQGNGSSPKFATPPVFSSPAGSPAGSPVDTINPSPFGALDSPRNDHLRRTKKSDLSSSGSLPNLDQASRGGGRQGPSHGDNSGQYADVDESPSSSSNESTPRAGRMSTQQHRQSAMPPSRLGGSSSNGGRGGPSNLSVSTIPPFANQNKQQQSSSSPSSSSAEERNGAISPEKHQQPAERIQASKISGPQGGAPIPAGFKFGAKDEVPDRDRKAKSGRWGFGGFGKMSEFASSLSISTCSSCPTLR